MNSYTKLFSSIIASTIWREDNATRLVWITMLAMRNRHQVVEASLPGLADLARVPIGDCERAIANLSSPDKYSRTKDHDGRRIKEVDGGWLILNGEKYQKLMSADDKREYYRIKKRESRERQRSQSNVNEVKECPPTSLESTHKDTDTDKTPLIPLQAGGENSAAPTKRGRKSPAERWAERVIRDGKGAADGGQ